jgi:hypothetical protein
MPRLTQDWLKHILDYNLETGVFTWKKPGYNKAQFIGKQAGYVNSKGYIVIEIDSTPYKAARLAWFYMTGNWPAYGMVIDHIDRNRRNNAFSNLREATPLANKHNSKDRQRKTFGVCRFENRWRVKFCINGRSEHFGLFDTKEEAIRAAQAVRARLGF